MGTKEFDVFVIGSGVAGQTVAQRCAKAGLKTAIADKREFGGTCANRGCDPKKVVLGATEVLEMAGHLNKKGILSMPKLSWKKLQRFKKEFTKAVPAATESDLREAGITLYHQSPKFLDEATLEVEGKTVKAHNIVIASGYEPRELLIAGSKYFKTSDDFLALGKMPKSLIFIGAGYIGMEFSHMAARAGCKVTLIDTGELPLSSFDPDLVNELTEYSKKLGIRFIFNAQVKSIEKLRKNYRLIYRQKGKSKNIKARMVFHTAGRVPAIRDMALEKGNVDSNDKGIITNGFLQSISNKNVYACGDVSDHSFPLTPLSGLEGYIVAENILNNNTKKINVPIIPSTVFTLPNLAGVGYSEEEAKKRYKNIVVKHCSVPNWFNAKRINAEVYAYKILINERTDKIVGAHLLSPEASETINLFAMAMNSGMTTEQLKNTIFTYPSWGNDIKSML